MLHIITYDFGSSPDSCQALCDKLSEMGETYQATESTIFLHTSVSAGLVDAAIRAIAPRQARFCVFDITGVTVDRYYGRVPQRPNCGNFWNWLKANNN